MEACTQVVGLILATPEQFTIVYANVNELPLLGPERLFELFTWFASVVLSGPIDIIEVGRPRCDAPPVGGIP